MSNPQKGQGQKAQFLNLKEDGLKIRASKFRNQKVYTRKVKHQNREA